MEPRDVEPKQRGIKLMRMLSQLMLGTLLLGNYLLTYVIDLAEMDFSAINNK